MLIFLVSVRGSGVKFSREAVTVKGIAQSQIAWLTSRSESCVHRLNRNSLVLLFSLGGRDKKRRIFMAKQNTQSKKTLIAVIALVVVVALAVGAYFLFFNNSGTPGAKELTVEVVHGDGSVKDFTIHTDEEYLRGAMEQEDLIQGTESEYGLFVTTVDGETADDSQQQWWCVTKGGEMLMTGVDSTPILDGEQYEFTLTTGW